MATRKKVAIEIEVIRGGKTQETVRLISQLELELDQLNRQLREAKKQGKTDTYTKLRGEVAGVRANLKGANAELRQQEKDLKALSFAPGSYNAISAEVSKLTRQFHLLSAEAREGIAGRDIQRRISSLRGELTRIDRSVGVFSRNVGNYASAFNKLVPVLGALGVSFGLIELIQQTKVAVQTYKDFQQEIATLQAISGATGDDLGRLEQNARRLGETTQFTALQVAQLETNFARIGFSADEIIAATASTVNLAIATTSSVERASEVMGAAINGFALSADEADRVGDVMAAAFNNSALNLDKWAEAQKYAATISAAAGVEIEGTAAAMGILADAGLEGSQIGTVLRRIMGDLSTEGTKLSEKIGFTVKSTEDFTKAMKVLGSESISTGEAFKLVGRIGQSGLLALAARGDDIVALTEKFQQAQGVAAATARIVGDTLAQDMLKAQSAIEGLRINTVSFADGALRNAVQGFTSFVDTLNQFVKIPVSKQIEEEQRTLNNLVTQLRFANLSEQERSDLIAEITVRNPKFVEGIDLETASVDELGNALAAANEEYQAKILLQKLAEAIDRKEIKLQKQKERVANQQFNATDALLKAQRVLNDETLDFEEALAKLEQTAKLRENRSSGIVEGVNAEGKAYLELKRVMNDLRFQEIQEEKAATALAEAQGERADRLELIRKQFPEIAALMDEISQRTDRSKESTDKQSASIADLRKRLAELKDELSETPETSPMFEQITAEIADIEEKLKAAGASLDETTKGFVRGSLAALQEELQKLQTELDNTPASAAKYVDLLHRINDAQEAVNDELERRKLLTFDVTDFVGSAEEVERSIKALEDALEFTKSIEGIQIEIFTSNFETAREELLKIEQERLASLQRQYDQGLITEKEYSKAVQAINDETIQKIQGALKFAQSAQVLKIETNVIDVDKSIAEIKRLEETRIRSFEKQLQEGKITEAQYSKERERISQETEIAILRARTAAFEVGSDEYIQLTREIADKEFQIRKQTADRILDYEKEIQRRKVDYAIQAADSLAGALIQVEQNRIQNETEASLDAIQEEYDAKIEAAGNNAAYQAQLEEELAEKRAAIEKEAAERRKKLAIATAIIDGALAAVKTMANLGFANPLLPIALAAQAVALAAQIAVISNTQFKKGGLIPEKFARGGQVSDKNLKSTESRKFERGGPVDDEKPRRSFRYFQVKKEKARGGLVKGRPHDQGGEEFLVQSTKQKVELEGGEGVVNKRSMASRDVITVSGTIPQIVSAVNSYRGFGDPFVLDRVKVETVKKVPKFETGGVIPSTPQLINPNVAVQQGFIRVTATFEDEQITMMAKRIANETAAQVNKAVETGIASGNRIKDRNQFVQNKTGIK